MFIGWAYNGANQNLQTQDLFNQQICTLDDRLRAIWSFLFFAEKYSFDELQDEILQLLIDACKKDESPLCILHARKCHENTSPKSKTRVFFIGFIAFVLQKLDTKGNWREREVALNCDLAQSSEEILVDLLDLPEGSSIRNWDKKLSGPHEASACTHHQHGPKKACPQKSPKNSSSAMSSMTVLFEDDCDFDGEV
ncbi:hypothetical protein OCU04_006636 [Sclerotinia nivalis]|uniref:Uncharacterized protein n=1 Tax=Sclerotinia nivalis TaxID=352851 RepID=A0A9X0DJ40_9HELO|nr:hypothetical protein OCU04_006636 [Sclerotinia nivalis]